MTVLACTCELTANSLVKLTSNHSHCSFRSVIKLSRLTLTKPIDTVEISWVIFLVQVVQGTIHQIDIAVEDLERDHFLSNPNGWCVLAGFLFLFPCRVSVPSFGLIMIIHDQWKLNIHIPNIPKRDCAWRDYSYWVTKSLGFFRRPSAFESMPAGCFFYQAAMPKNRCCSPKNIWQKKKNMVALRSSNNSHTAAPWENLGLVDEVN